MKKTLGLLLASTLVISACSNHQEESKEQKDTKVTTKTSQHSAQKKSGQTPTQVTTDSEGTNQATSKSSNQAAIDVTNIKDRATLEAVIYGNFSEYDKIKAYNSAVANGVIPQGNVLEGPAWAAYESSLKIERGEEKSIFDNPPAYNDHSYEEAPYDDYWDDTTEDAFYEVIPDYDENADYGTYEDYLEAEQNS